MTSFFFFGLIRVVGNGDNGCDALPLPFRAVLPGMCDRGRLGDCLYSSSELFVSGEDRLRGDDTTPAGEENLGEDL